MRFLPDGWMPLGCYAASALIVVVILLLIALPFVVR
jgi:hypothetical protein